jgi:hypothetical protein
MSESEEDRVNKINEATRERIARTKPKTLATEQMLADERDYGFVEPQEP